MSEERANYSVNANQELASALWEQETIIGFNELEGEAELYTASKRVASLLERRGLTPSRVDRLSGKPCGWTFILPKWAAIIKPGRTAIRIGGSRKASSVAPGAAIGATRKKASV
jgi:hypothetical protein